MLVSRAHAQDSNYQAKLIEARSRLQTLEIQRHSYPRENGKEWKPTLPPDLEAERYQLLGQLFSDDPIWSLMEELTADMYSLTAPFGMIRPNRMTVSERAVHDELKAFLAITCYFQERATTLEQAKIFATTLRTFIVLRDVSGAEAWAKKQLNQ